MKPTAFPNLDGLLRLAKQDGVDVRPTLVRVLTDIFVQKQRHSPDEARRFTELALWLLPSVDHATRSAVAHKLAAFPETPREVARALAADLFDIAEPVLRQSPCLTSEDLLAISVERGGRHAQTIAARGRSDATVTEMVDDPDPEVQARPTDPGLSNQTAAGGATTNVGASFERLPLGERFLRANVDERRAILADLVKVSDVDTIPFPSAPADAIARLEAAALDRKPEEFARGLQPLLRLSWQRALEIVEDEHGEPVVIVAKAIGMPADVLLRVLLFLNPAIGESIPRVFDLVEVHYQLTSEAAHTLVSGWRETRLPEKRKARYQPVHWDDEAGSRRSSADPARRQINNEQAKPLRTKDADTERRQRKT